MAALDFPSASSSPWVAPNGVIYTYIGTSPNGYWEANTANASQNLTNLFVVKTGSTMSGALKLDNAANPSNPDLAFDGDSNTGIYSPAANTVGITTAGTQRFVVDSSGNVLVGKATSSGLNAGCEFRDNGMGLFTRASGNPVQVRRLTDDGDLVEFYQDAGLIGSIGVQGTSLTVGMAGPEKLRIDSTGKVGIGCIPVRDLQLHTSDSTSELMLSNSTTGATTGSGFMIQLDGNDTYVWNKENSFMSFGTNAIERMRIDSSGNIGIGTTSPAHNLDISPASGAAELKIAGAEGQEASIRLYADQGDDAADIKKLLTDTSGNFKIQHYSGSAFVDSMVIDSSGRLLVGSTSAYVSDANFQVTDDTNAKLVISNPGNATYSLAVGTDNALAVKDEANGIERMRIDISGNVAIGATSSTSKLRVIGNEIRFSNSANASYYGTITHDAGTTGANIYNNVDATTASHIWQHSGGEIMRLDNAARLLLGTTAAGYTNAADNLTIADNGNCGMTIRSASGFVSSIYFADGTSGSALYEGFIDYQHSVGDLRFGTGGGQEQMRINSAGAMGLGVVPSALGGNSLEIHSAGSVNSFLALTNSTTGSNGSVHGFNIIMSDNEARLFNRENGDMTFWTNGTERVRIDSTGNLILKHTGKYILRENNLNAFSMYTDGANGSLIFKDEYNAVERMRHDQYGLNIGKTGYVDMVTDGHHLNKAGWGHHCSTNDNALYLNRNGTDGNIVAIYKAGSYRGNIYVNSSGTTFNSVSDYRLKENIIDITDGITRIKQLSPRRFNFITDADLTVDGFIAHEAQVVVPEAVCGAKDGEEMQGIDQSKLVPLLTAALQEAIAKIETLEQRLSVAGIA